MSRAEREAELVSAYNKSFAERGENADILPDDPLEFHLYHLARYWGRLTGFCNNFNREYPEGYVEGDLGFCVKFGSECVDDIIAPSSPIYGKWREYCKHTQAIFDEKSVTTDQINLASGLFNECLSILSYDPWANKKVEET